MEDIHRPLKIVAFSDIIGRQDYEVRKEFQD
jgi:hypothetical protein